MGTNFQQSGTSAVITLEGEITLPHAGELRHALIKALIDSDDISISLANAQAVDLSCLQLFCSAHRSAVRLKKRLCLSGPLPRVFTDMVEAAGFGRLTGCKLDTEKSCLWAAAHGA
jgi:anti-anti-sigma regulatory factor